MKPFDSGKIYMAAMRRRQMKGLIHMGVSRCNASTCHYNVYSQCKKAQITVTGHGAHVHCASYTNKFYEPELPTLKDPSMTSGPMIVQTYITPDKEWLQGPFVPALFNSVGDNRNVRTVVTCGEVHCAYNSGNRCLADGILIGDADTREGDAHCKSYTG